MSDYRSYDRDPRRGYDERPIRTNSGAVGPKPGISRSSSSRAGAPRSSAARPSGSRPAQHAQGQRPSGSRTSQGGRPSQGNRPYQGNRRPTPRKRRRGVQPRFFAILAVLVVIVVAVIVIANGGKKTVEPMTIPTVEPASGSMSNATIASATPDPSAPDAGSMDAGSADTEAVIQQQEAEAENDNAPVISSADQVQISPEQLCVNTSLPGDWLNVLLLGTDERNLSDPARTDAMIIASINTATGEVKLTSLMRDTAVSYSDLGEHNGTYRINAANYFGGPLYAIKTVNELLDMNIQYYVSVNFFGFTRIVEALGGIEVDITEAEMNEINDKQVYQYVVAGRAGIDESDIPNEFLTTYGPNTHLNGRQTLAYARVRYVDNDFGRAERQRTVIIKLTEKLRGKSATDIFALLMSLSDNVTTNLDLDTAGSIAITVLSSGLTGVETLYLPKAGTYQLDRRNDQEMFYDTDWEQNAMLLYNFIYE